LYGLSTGPSVSASLDYFKEQLFACEETDAGELGRPTHHTTFTWLIFNDLRYNAVHLSQSRVQTEAAAIRNATVLNF